MPQMELVDEIRCVRVLVEGEELQRVRMEIPTPLGVASIWYKPDEAGLQGVMDLAEINRLENLFEALELQRLAGKEN